MQTPSLLVPLYRIPSNPYLFLASLPSQEALSLVHSQAENPSASSFPPLLTTSTEQIKSGEKILEFLWNSCKLSKTQGVSFHREGKDFVRIWKLFEEVGLLFTEKLPNNEEKLKEISNSINGLEPQEAWIHNPPLAIVLYETLYAISGVDSKLLGETLLKFKKTVEITKLYQSFLFNSENLLRPIGPFQPNPHAVIKAKIVENLPTIIDFAGLNSALYTYQQDQMLYWDHVPVSAFPTLEVRQKEIDILREKSLTWNKLFDRMVRRIHIFDKVFEELAQVDVFVNHLWKISQRKREKKKSQGLEFCIFRNDYLRDGALDQWKQVEFNAISASFGFMSDSTQKLHHVLFNQLFSEFNKGKQLACLPDASHLLADGLAHAHKLYGNPKKTKILFIVGATEGNILDQRGIELDLGYRGVLVIRRTFEEIMKQISVKKEDNALFIGNQEISVVYYRHGYSPSHYPNMDYWDVRETIEMSKAIKCPSVEFQLVNFKKIQEVLQRKSILSQLLDTQEEIDKITEDFVPIWSLDTANEQEAALELVKSQPEDYVLKPQREGGGNNTYGAEILEKFHAQHAKSELKAFILMKRIKPSPRIGFLLKRRELKVCGVISELGLYSYLISEEKHMLESRYGGYLLRTKHFETDEGGVATGYSVLDSLVFEQRNEQQA